MDNNYVGDVLQKFSAHAHKNAIWVIVLGILLIVFGTFALIYMSVATLAAVYCFGALMVVGGIFQIIGAFQIYSGGRAWLWALCGLLYLFAGWLTFSNPFIAGYFLTVFLAAALVVGGIFRIINGFQVKPFIGWGWTVFSGGLTLLTGLLIFSTPTSPFWVIGMFLGIDMIFQGWSYVSIGSAVRSLKEG